jgi:molybdopterin-guanine dinucleotide biosynthesis protein A
MGLDKAGLVLGGETLLARAVGGARCGCAARVPRLRTLPRYAELGRELVLDRRAGGGPLAGLESALLRLVEDGAAGSASSPATCRAPTPACSRAARRPRAGAGAGRGLLRGQAGLEPLFGVVHVRALPAIQAALERGERRCIAFHGDVRVDRVRADELPVDLRARGVARNLNTPAELAHERGGVR